MYQVSRGSCYEGGDFGKFFYEFDNAVERALLVLEEESEYLPDEYFWQEIKEEKKLKDWNCKKLWLQLSKDEGSGYEYIVINEVKIEDCAKVDNGIMAYTKEEIK